jgi:hypothetical protein
MTEIEEMKKAAVERERQMKANKRRERQEFEEITQRNLQTRKEKEQQMDGQSTAGLRSMLLDNHEKFAEERKHKQVRIAHVLIKLNW